MRPQRALRSGWVVGHQSRVEPDATADGADGPHGWRAGRVCLPPRCVTSARSMARGRAVPGAPRRARGRRGCRGPQPGCCRSPPGSTPSGMPVPASKAPMARDRAVTAQPRPRRRAHRRRSRAPLARAASVASGALGGDDIGRRAVSLRERRRPPPGAARRGRPGARTRDARGLTMTRVRRHPPIIAPPDRTGQCVVAPPGAGWWPPSRRGVPSSRNPPNRRAAAVLPPSTIM